MRLHALDLSSTSSKLTGLQSGIAVMGLLQSMFGPAEGDLLLDSGESVYGGREPDTFGRSGRQHDYHSQPTGPTEFNSTLVGVDLDSCHSETFGRLIHRIGDGKADYRTKPGDS